MKSGFLRVAAASPTVVPADVERNTAAIEQMLQQLEAEGVELALFPELSLTGYTCGDLFHQQRLLEGARHAVAHLSRQLRGRRIACVVGAPVAVAGRGVYNCGILLTPAGDIHVVAKRHLPGYNEFYEPRWFRPAPEEAITGVTFDGLAATFLPDGIYDVAGARVAIELCEDLWVAAPPSVALAQRGAEVIANLSATDALIGKRRWLETLLKAHSGRCLCAYAYASCGEWESSTDLVFIPRQYICENGRMVAQECPVANVRIADVDILALRRDRLHTTTFAGAADTDISYTEEGTCDLRYRHVAPLPFVPPAGDERDDRCREVLDIQSRGLATRLHAIGCRSAVIGISGGLDSTLALLVAVQAFDRLGIPRKGILGVTMPGYGTTTRTRSNAEQLMEALGVTMLTIPIVPAVEQHFHDIGHDASVHDVTYENAQARYRTMLLMDLANSHNGIVVGTGDMSELALGWATYNGDHMSMYGVNAGVPKTLVRHLVEYTAATCGDARLSQLLLDVAATPVSPELLPPDAEGKIAQKTEDLVGPYALHDFFLYYTLRYGFDRERISLLARHAFAGTYSDDVIGQWLDTFYRRFFSQQYKRSCMPDGPKVGSVSLSPRGDWRMPSDASSALFRK